MTIYDALKARIITAAGHSRVYFARLPQRPTYPAISFWRVTSSGTESLSSGPAAMQRYEMQIDVWSQEYDEAHETADALRQSLQGVYGALGTFNVSVGNWAERDQYHDDAQPPAVHQVICTCSVWFGDL